MAARGSEDGCRSPSAIADLNVKISAMRDREQWMDVAECEGLGTVVGIGGTTRPGSSSEKAVRAVLARIEARGGRTRMFDGPAIAAFPHYAPENPERSPAQCEFLAAVRQADALVVGTPGYHGGVSGLVKNALDLLEDIRDDARPYLDRRAIGCIVSAAGWQAGGTTLGALRGIVHALRGWPTPLGVTLNTVAANPFDAAGRCTDAAVSRQFDNMADQLIWFARAARSG